MNKILIINSLQFFKKFYYIFFKKNFQKNEFLFGN